MPVAVWILAFIIWPGFAAADERSQPAVAGDQDPSVKEKADSAGSGLKVIYVVTEDQKLFAWDGNELVFEFDVVTGRPGKETHPGVFNVFRKHKEYTSKTYGAEMPYSMFFTEDGKAIHGTTWAVLRSYVHSYLTEHVGSMGCVGLTEDDAEKIFAWAPVGTRVVVVEEEAEE